MDGDTAVIGAYTDDDGGEDRGSAYVFVRSGETWIQQAKLTASDAAAGDNFGVSVALSGDSALVGAFGDDDGSMIPRNMDERCRLGWTHSTLSARQMLNVALA